jgi:callose synthase
MPRSARLTKAYQTAAILFEVLRAVNDSQSVEVDQAVCHPSLAPMLGVSVFFLDTATPCLAPLFIDHNCEPSLCVAAAQILDTHIKVEEKKKLFLPYNILPLDPESTGEAIMRYPEVLVFHLLSLTAPPNYTFYKQTINSVLFLIIM